MAGRITATGARLWPTARTTGAAGNGAADKDQGEETHLYPPFLLAPVRLVRRQQHA